MDEMEKLATYVIGYVCVYILLNSIQLNATMSAVTQTNKQTNIDVATILHCLHMN